MKGKRKGKVPKKTEKLIYQEAKSKCAFCPSEDVHSLEVHHIRGWEDGGGNEPENLILVCGNCHSKITYGVLSLADVMTKKMELYWTARASSPVAPTPPPQPKAGVHQEIHGNGNVQSVNVFTDPPRIRKVIERREGSLTSEECRQVQAWVQSLAEETMDLPRSDAYKKWWGHFKSAFHVEKYEELPSAKMGDVERWYQIMRAEQTKGLKSKAPDEWRRLRYAAIKAAMTRLGVTNADYYPDVARRLRMNKSFVSLKDLTKRDLDRVYKMALRDARMS